MNLGNIFTPADLTVVWKIGVAIVLAGLVGLEREIRGRPAGLRTMIIVCLGATLVTALSVRMSSVAADGAAVAIDPGRIIAGVLTGIGFIGAGVILKVKDLIRGVTTAACIWFIAAVGVAIGHGYYVMAAAGAAACLAVLWGLHFVELALRHKVYRSLALVVAGAKLEGVRNAVEAELAKRGVHVMDVELVHDGEAGTTEFDFAVRTRRGFRAHELVEALAKLDGVRRTSWRVRS